MPKRPTWGKAIDQHRKDDFVGRSDCVRAFSNNLSTDSPQYLVFFVTGEGGVGKSTLLKQFATVPADLELDAIIITCDDSHPSPVRSMAHIARVLAQHGIRSEKFDERLKAYRALQKEIESDAKAPRGALNLVLRGMTDFAIKSARRAPGIGVFADYVDEREAGEALTLGVNYLIDRYGNRDEIDLIRQPESILTPLFISLLETACDTRKVVVMFDVFEQTRDSLEPWLLHLLNMGYGDIDQRASFVISGRDKPFQDWTVLGSAAYRIHLEPFTAEETGQYLAKRDITIEL